MVLKILLQIYLMRTIKRFGYFSNDWVPSTKRIRKNIVAAHRSEEVYYEMKKNEITRVALEQIYISPCVKETKQITPRQMRLKLILHEALDIAYAICEHGDIEECKWAWEMVDEIDDAATRAGVRYE
jgi:hypothetical protein